MGLFNEGEEIVLDQAVEDSTGTLCQPGTYVVVEFEAGWYDRETGAGDSAWVFLIPVLMTDAQADFFADFFPERYTFDPNAVLKGWEQGRAFLAAEERAEEEMGRAAEEMARSEERAAA
jgi:hypothetical protein